MLLPLLLTLAAPAADWTRLRGPNGSGIAEGVPLPNELSSTSKTILWKTPIPTGKSSPAVTADRIYLTGHENNKLQTFALDRKSGPASRPYTVTTRIFSPRSIITTASKRPESVSPL